MPGLGQFIQIPGLGDLEDSAPRKIDISDDSCHDTNTQHHNEPQASSSMSEPPSPLANAINHAPVNIDGLPKENTVDNQESDQEAQSSSGVEMAEQAANDEWQRQHMTFHNNKEIHHFNYLGHGVAGKNATPPALSLLVAVTGAKAGFFYETEGPPDPYGYAVMRNATRLVDPVIYHGLAENLCLRGESLREAATGFCENFYSEHGTWRNGKYAEDEDRPVLDQMNVLAYPYHSLPVNGWFRHPLVMDRWGLQTESYNLTKWQTKKQQEILSHQHACERKKSLLRNITTAEDLDAAPEDRMEVPKLTTPLKNVDEPKKFDSGWTVDIDKFLGKCDNWADEVDDEDEPPVEESTASPLSDTPSAPVKSDADEAETDAEGETVLTSTLTSDIATTLDTLPEPALTKHERLGSQDDEMNKLQPSSPLLQVCTMHDSSTPGDAAFNLVGRSVEGLTEEELEAEDHEIYGSSSAAPEDLSHLFQRLRESGLISQNGGTGVPSQASKEEPDWENSTPTLESEPVSLGGSFSLLIRQKPVPPAEDPQTVSSTSFDVTSLASSSSSSSFPTRVKLPGSVNSLEDTTISFAVSHDKNRIAASSASGDGSAKDASVRSSTAPTNDSASGFEDEYETDSNEKMSPIPSEKLGRVILPLRPRKAHARRLTDSPSDLLEITSKAWPEVHTSDDVEHSPLKRTAQSESTSLILPTGAFETAIMSPKQMVEKFKNASLTPSKKHPGIPRSGSFANLKDISAKTPSRIPQRQFSVLFRNEPTKTSNLLLPKGNAQSKVDKLYAIAEEEETEARIQTSPKELKEMMRTSSDTIGHNSDVQVDLFTLPAMPIRSPYKRPAPNTPRKMMGRSIRWDLPEDTESDDSVEDAGPRVDVEDITVTGEGTGEHAFYAFNNWSGVFGHDDNNELPPPTPVSLNDVPLFGGGLPNSGSSTATESEDISPLYSSDTSLESDETRATTPVEAPKTVRDVKFIGTGPPKSTWVKIKEKVTVQPLLPKLPVKRAGFRKSVKKFLRKGIEAFAVSL